MAQLQVLECSENEIADITQGLKGMTSLRKIVLTKNKITSLEGFPRLPAL
jgi:Leucine-rich repeat (LRR) protein